MGCCQPKLVTAEHYELEVTPPSEHEYINSELLEMIKKDPVILFRKTDVKACFHPPTPAEPIEQANSDNSEKSEKESKEVYA